MNDLYTIDNAKSTAPRPESLTGTVDSENYHVIGTGTQFLSEVQVGDYVVNYTSNEVRRVKDVKSDTLLGLNKPFSSEMSSAGLVIVPENNLTQFMVLENNGAAQASIDGESFRAGSRKEFGQLNGQLSRVRSPKPMIVDATGTQVDVTSFK